MSILMNNALSFADIPVEDDVERLGLFPKGHVTVVAGEPGVGKTWFMLSVMRSVCDGDYGLGLPLDRYSAGKVLIFAGETGVRLLARRLKLLGGMVHTERCRIVSAYECARLDIDTMLNTAIGRQNIREAIDDFRPDIVFFDTMISFMGGGADESSQVDMADSIRGISTIASQYKCAVVLVHHFRKRKTSVEAGDRGIDEVIGSSAFTRLASLVMSIERKRHTRLVRCLKSWWEEFDPFAFTIVAEKEGVKIVADYAYDKDGGSAPTKVARLLCGRIQEKFPTGRFTQADVQAALEVSRSATSEAINILIGARKLHVVGKGDYGARQYSFTEDALTDYQPQTIPFPFTEDMPAPESYR